MDVQQSSCDRQTIERFLADRLTEAEQIALESHLGDCPACRQCLDELAADDNWWQETRGFLSDGQSGGGVAEAGYCTMAGLRPYLTPTDDPRFLGRLGGYGVVGLIGCGGFGVVLKAFDAALNRYVAIKVLSPHLAASGAARQRFAREAKAAAAVMHDNVIAIHAVAEADGLPYFVMPYISGPSLEKRLRQTGALAPVEVVRIALQIASGLAAAHAQGLVHRDIKPANILLAEGVERVTITDFGLARAVDDASLTKSGVIAGTPQYMSPEQAAGLAVDHRSDLFSLGSVMYATCTGRPAFRADATLAVLRRVDECRPRPIREVNPEIPEWLARVIATLHAKDPADRFQTAAEVAELLEGYLFHLTQPLAAPPPPLPAWAAAAEPAPLRSQPRRPRWLAVVAVACGLAGLAAGLAGQSQPPPANSPTQFYQEFRTGRPWSADLKWTGRDGTEVVEPDDRGLRIKLGPNRTRKDPAGVALVTPVRGDFTITAGYELLSSNIPQAGNGVGFELYLMTNAPSQDALAVARIRRGGGSVSWDDLGQLFLPFHAVLTPGRVVPLPPTEQFSSTLMSTVDGRRKFNWLSALGVGPVGQVRIERIGREVILRAADGMPGGFREIARYPFVTDDLSMVRVAAYPGQSTEPVDVRLVDLRVQAKAIETDMPDTALRRGNGGRQHRWLAAAAGVVLLVLFGVILAAVRRRLAGEVDPQAAAPASAHGDATPDATAPGPTSLFQTRRTAWWAAGAVAACGLVGLTVWGIAKKAATRRQPARPQPEVYHDFRGGKGPLPPLELFGVKAADVTRPDDRGLHIVVAANPEQTQRIGLTTPQPIRGAFEITASYEIVRAEQPERGQGVGVCLIADFDSPDGEVVELMRAARVGEGNIYGCMRKTVEAGKEAFQHQWFPTECRAGQMRLTRIGAEMIYSVRESGSDKFEELLRMPCGTEDVKQLRFAAYMGFAPNSVDVFLKDLRIGAPGGPAGSAAVGGTTTSSSAWPAAAGVGLFVLLGLAAVTALRRRGVMRSNDVGAPLLVTFACPECGAAVKAPAEFAGKKGKCPKCGKAVPVPAAMPEPATGILSRRRIATIVTLVVAGSAAVLVWALWPADNTPSANAENQPPAALQERHLAFKGLTAKCDELELFGPDAAECVRFEPDGLRIKTSPGFLADHPSTGVVYNTDAKGDFEVTTTFEILREPKSADVPGPHIRFTMDAVLESQDDLAALSRRVARPEAAGGGMLDIVAGLIGNPQRAVQPENRGAQFLSYLSAAAGGGKERFRIFPAAAKTGRLRMTRTGSTLSFDVAEGSGGDFRRLDQVSIGTGNLREVRLVDGGGGPDGWLDVRVTDFHIRAESLPNAPDAGSKPAWKKGYVAAYLMLIVGLGCILGIWRQRRRSRSADEEARPAAVPSEASAGRQP